MTFANDAARLVLALPATTRLPIALSAVAPSLARRLEMSSPALPADATPANAAARDVAANDARPHSARSPADGVTAEPHVLPVFGGRVVLLTVPGADARRPAAALSGSCGATPGAPGLAFDACDFGNALMALLGNLELLALEQALGADVALLALLGDVRSAAERALVGARQLAATLPGAALPAAPDGRVRFLPE